MPARCSLHPSDLDNRSDATRIATRTSRSAPGAQTTRHVRYCKSVSSRAGAPNRRCRRFGFAHIARPFTICTRCPVGLHPSNTASETRNLDRSPEATRFLAVRAAIAAQRATAPAVRTLLAHPLAVRAQPVQPADNGSSRSRAGLYRQPPPSARYSPRAAVICRLRLSISSICASSASRRVNRTSI